MEQQIYGFQVITPSGDLVFCIGCRLRREMVKDYGNNQVVLDLSNGGTYVIAQQNSTMARIPELHPGIVKVRDMAVQAIVRTKAGEVVDLRELVYSERQLAEDKDYFLFEN